MNADALEDSRTWLIRFARQMPALLGQHAGTADLAVRFNALALERQLERRFTLAIVGRMKAGKSTLLNALVERSLAPVGVTETTATINWFEAGTEEDAALFEVHWSDPSRPPERRPHARLAEFCGRGTAAGAVRYLRFFAPTAFLDNVRIVDTPGFGSTILTHEDTIAGYLGAARGRESDAADGRADAVLLVMSHSAREIDTRALADFQKHTRFPGQGPYNSIAVLQKWESFEGNPVEEARRIASALAARLRGRVADVVPISGLLHQLSREAEIAQLNAIAALAGRLSAEALARATLDEASFRSDPAHAALQDALITRLGGSAGDQVDLWPILRFVLRLVQHERIADGQALRERLRCLSGIDDLRRELHRRFFKLSELIRAGAISMRALDLCEQARVRLRDEHARLAALAGEDAIVDTGLAAGRLRDPELAGRLAATLSLHRTLRDQMATSIGVTVAALDDWIRDGHRHFELLLSDVEQIERLDDPAIDLDDDATAMLRSLFGIYGIDLCKRLSLEVGASPATLRGRADDWLATISTLLRVAAGPMQRQVLRHAMNRLQVLHRLLDGMEMNSAEN